MNYYIENYLCIEKPQTIILKDNIYLNIDNFIIILFK